MNILFYDYAYIIITLAFLLPSILLSHAICFFLSTAGWTGGQFCWAVVAGYDWQNIG
jgi:hypothetical protein